MTTATPIQVEQRQAPRVLYRDLKISYEDSTDMVEVRSPDLTSKGMFINTRRPFPPGARLKLRFDLLRTGVIVQALGDVRYCLQGIGIGVQFVDLPEQARAAIETELEEIKKSEARIKE